MRYTYSGGKPAYVIILYSGHPGYWAVKTIHEMLEKETKKTLK